MDFVGEYIRPLDLHFLPTVQERNEGDINHFVALLWTCGIGLALEQRLVLLDEE